MEVRVLCSVGDGLCKSKNDVFQTVAVMKRSENINMR